MRLSTTVSDRFIVSVLTLAASVAAVGCGRTPVIPDPRREQWCPAANGETPPQVPKIGVCNQLSPEGPTFGCYGERDCERIVVACQPRLNHGEGPFQCCSDDPAAVGGGLPAYEGLNPGGQTPYFSGRNNAVGTSGACVRVDDTIDGLLEPEAEGCPVPCNPTWDPESIELICGTEQVCCQTRAVGRKDCIRDEIQQRHRPIDGTDIGHGHPWRPGDHDTHQDPNGDGCLGLAGGDTRAPQFRDCVRQLSVANQRGFCTQPGNCCASVRYTNVCEQFGD